MFVTYLQLEYDAHAYTVVFNASDGAKVNTTAPIELEVGWPSYAPTRMEMVIILVTVLAIIAIIMVIRLTSRRYDELRTAHVGKDLEERIDYIRPERRKPEGEKGPEPKKGAEGAEGAEEAPAVPEAPPRPEEGATVVRPPEGPPPEPKAPPKDDIAAVDDEVEHLDTELEKLDEEIEEEEEELEKLDSDIDGIIDELEGDKRKTA
jgi:cell division protein FtsL